MSLDEDPVMIPNGSLPYRKTVNKRTTILFYLFQSMLSFAQNLSFQFLPIFNRKLGATETQMGLLTSVQNVFSTLFSPFFGRLSDIYGRRQFLMLGGIIATGSAMAMSQAQNPSQMIFAVGINAFGLSIIVPSWAGAQADVTEGGARGGFIGRLLGVGSGFTTIALMAYAFISPRLPVSEIDNYRIILIISAICFALVVVLSWFFLDYRGSREARKYTFLTPLYDTGYRRFMIVILFWWIGMSVAWSYFPLVMVDIVDASTGQVAILAAVMSIVQAIASYTMADFIDKIGPRRSVVLGFLPFALVPLFFGIATQWWHLVLPQVVAGIGIGFGFSALQVYIITFAGSEKAGNYQGTYNIFWGLLTFGGSFFGGWFLDWYADNLGDFALALRNALVGIMLIRFVTMFVLYRYLPQISNTENL